MDFTFWPICQILQLVFWSFLIYVFILMINIWLSHCMKDKMIKWKSLLSIAFIIKAKLRFVHLLRRALFFCCYMYMGKKWGNNLFFCSSMKKSNLNIFFIYNLSLSYCYHNNVFSHFFDSYVKIYIKRYKDQIFVLSIFIISYLKMNLITSKYIKHSLNFSTIFSII